MVSPGAVKIESPTQNLELRKQIKIYGIRWYILAIFSSYVTLQYFIWNTFGPIASSVKKVYSWENSDVATLANWDTILYVIFAMQLCWLVQEKGIIVYAIETVCKAVGKTLVGGRKNIAT